MAIFITGGSRGIGKDLVFSALAQAQEVAFTFNNSAEQAQQIILEAKQYAPTRKCLAYQLDVKDSAAVENVVDKISEDFDSIDAVVCNAGINRNNLAFSMSNEEWQEVIDTNLTGAFYIIRQCLPVFLAAGKGRFVFLSSIAKDGMSGQINYSASKAGLVGLSGAIAKEYGRKGITSNVIVPGFFDTDMTRTTMSDGLKDFWMQHCPLKRMGELKELSEVILFLASDRASFVSGQVIPVTGGLDWGG